MPRSLTLAERQRSTKLRRAKRHAGELLAAVSALFLASTILSRDATWLGWVQATAVASMVGALADWFAVTALFRRPLGLPIPHTAIIVERKDSFADTLGTFVQESLLTPDAVVERIESTGMLRRGAEWLAAPDHAEELARHVVAGLAAGAELLQEDDVRDALHGLLRDRLERVALAPLAGRALARLTRDGRHEPILEAALSSAARYLDHHGDELVERLGRQSPWWLPGPLEERLVARLLRRATGVLREMSEDHSHPLRRQLHEGLLTLAGDLQTSAELLARGEALKAELISQPQLRAFAGTLWNDAKRQLREQESTGASGLTARLARVLLQAGASLRDDPGRLSALQRGVEAALRSVLGRFDHEIADLIRATIARWDGIETSHRLELLLGPDLQYIRINGTVVGAIAGLALHAVAHFL